MRVQIPPAPPPLTLPREVIRMEIMVAYLSFIAGISLVTLVVILMKKP